MAISPFANAPMSHANGGNESWTVCAPAPDEPQFTGTPCK
jgi:hypothetical protein